MAASEEVMGSISYIFIGKIPGENPGIFALETGRYLTNKS